MFTFIDLCCGFGSMTKAFEKTGRFKCVGAYDIDPNMQTHYNYLLNRKPFGDFTSKKNRHYLSITDFDILVAGIAGLNENIFFSILEIVEEKKPKAFVLEMSRETIYFSFCNILEHFCMEQGYHFVGFEGGIDNITLNQMDFCVPEYCERVYCVCIKKENLHCDDILFLQLTKEKKWKDYKYRTYDPDKHIEQKRGIDFGFGEGFKFLINTPDLNKKTIIEEASPMTVVTSVALDLMSWIKD